MERKVTMMCCVLGHGEKYAATNQREKEEPSWEGSSSYLRELD